MIDHVAVPVDFTPESDRALMVAPAIARWAGAHVELVSVTEPSNRPDVDATLAEYADRVGPGTKWTVLESGGPTIAALLTEFHRSTNALWCVGSHARGALGELLVGSLSERLVREAHAPVVLVGPHVSAAPSGRVLAVALDGTPAAEAILPPAAALAVDLGLTLRLLQVGEPAPGQFPGDAYETGYLSSAAATITSIERHEIDYDILHGPRPARALADHVATRPEVGMVAMATRGLQKGDRLLHGSTAFDLAHRAVVPVAILHHV
jgi:nucleotide-binding universal stress UspA family protein